MQIEPLWNDHLSGKTTFLTSGVVVPDRFDCISLLMIIITSKVIISYISLTDDYSSLSAERDVNLTMTMTITESLFTYRQQQVHS